MTDDKSAVPTQKQRRPFVQLTPALSQLVDDRFDEDQYDQAVELLEQLRAEGLRPPKGVIQKLVGLSLCSLAPGQVASTSRWTLDHQLHDIAARLLTQHKSGKSDRNVMKAASSTSDRPSGFAVLKASSLLLQYSRSTLETSADNTQAQSGAERRASALPRHVLESLPSQRKPLPSPKAAPPDSAPMARRGSERLDDSDHDASFEVSPIEKWVRDHLHHAEDVWDLLSDRRFSHATEVEDTSLARVTEFWMNDSERKRYQKQLQAGTTNQQRLADRLKDIRRRKLSGAVNSDSSDSDSDDASDEDGLGRKLSIPGRGIKRNAKGSTRGKSSTSPQRSIKRERTDKPAAPPGNDDAAPQTKIKMTEGAWRTLSVLLWLWDRASPRDVAADAKTSSRPVEEPPLLWQFPRSHLARQNGRPISKSSASKDATDEIDRALDVAFSFPSILPAYVPSTSNGAEVTTNLFDTAKAIETRGDARLFSSVPEAELMHRQQVGRQKEERLMATRAEAAAWLLSSIYELVKLHYISGVALFEGMSQRLEALGAQEIQYLVLPLLIKQPYVVANVLSCHLGDTTRTRPDKHRAPDQVLYHFDGQGAINMDAALAYAMPRELAATAILRARSIHQQDLDAKAVLHFLSLHKLELDDAANSNLTMTLLNRSESRKRAVVQKQSRRQFKVQPDSGRKARMTLKLESPDAANTVVTEEMKKGGLVAFAFVRLVQMEARDRINQMKFFIARAMISMMADKQGTQSKTDSGADTKASTARVQNQAADPNDDKPVEVERASQRRNVQLYMTRLYKALEHDVADFRTCLAAMKTHLSKDSAGRHRKNLADLLEANSSDRDAPVALPSFETLVDRCQKCFDATQDLAHTTRMLLDSTKLL